MACRPTEIAQIIRSACIVGTPEPASARPVRGTHKGHWCQEGIGELPGGFYVIVARAGFGCSSWIFLTAALVHVTAQPGSSCSARSRVAARTNKLNAGKRRRIVASGEDPDHAGLLRVVTLSPAWLAEWSRKHPSGAAQCAGVAIVRDRAGDYLRFAPDLRVPFGNNQAEQVIRMSKLRIKVSGCMRSMTGAETFCAIRSYLATAARHGISWLDALTRAAGGNPWIPAHHISALLKVPWRGNFLDQARTRLGEAAASFSSAPHPGQWPGGRRMTRSATVVPVTVFAHKGTRSGPSAQLYYPREQPSHP